jgi:hypothetical protein
MLLLINGQAAVGSVLDGVLGSPVKISASVIRGQLQPLAFAVSYLLAARPHLLSSNDAPLVPELIFV